MHNLITVHYGSQQKMVYTVRAPALEPCFLWIRGFKLVIVGLSVFFAASHTEFPTWYVVAVTGPDPQPALYYHERELPVWSRRAYWAVLFYDAARRVTVDPGDRSKGSVTQNYLASISDSRVQTVWFRVTDFDFFFFFFACKMLAVCLG